MERYSTKHQWRMKEAEDGDWVRYSEVEELQADLELTKECNEQLQADVSFYRNRTDNIHDGLIEVTYRLGYWKNKAKIAGYVIITLVTDIAILLTLYSFGLL